MLNSTTFQPTPSYLVSRLPLSSPFSSIVPEYRLLCLRGNSRRVVFGHTFIVAIISNAARDDTLTQIADFANDVEMLEPANAGPALYLVLDTNVLIHNLNLIRAFCEDLDTIPLPWSMKIIVPSVVLSELDGLKNREGPSWFARTASTFLLQKVKEKRSLRVQARSETLHTKPLDHEKCRTEDIAIWDCCLFYKSKPNSEVVLLTNDKNLQILCENEEPKIPTVAPGKREWSSRELATALFGKNLDSSQFRTSVNAPKYRPTRDEQSKHLAHTEAPRTEEDDGMDVDDDASQAVEAWVPSHALDALHLQIIDHFAIVLKELAHRVRQSAGDVGPPAQSRFAPEHRRKAFHDWNVRNCVEYLASKKPVKPSQPPLETFLLRRSEDRGWRRGQDWPRQAWENSLDALEDIGRQFEDGLVLLSLRELRPHVTDVFNTRMRPTGI